MKYVLYSAIHNKNLVYETLYSLLTLFHHSKLDKDTQVVICTNFVKLFKKEMQKHCPELESLILFDEVDDAVVKEWIYDDFPYTIKINLLKYFLKKYQSNVLFIDSDMYIQKDVSELFHIIDRKEFVMFDSHCDVYTTFAQHMITYDNFNTLLLKEPKVAGPFDVHYRSGILGIHSSFAHIFDDILSMSIAIYNYTKIHTSEEIAFACVLQKHSKVHTTEDYFDHYSTMHFIRIIIGYTFGCFFGQDKRRYHEWLRFYNLDEQLLNDLQIKYDDVQSFCYLFNTYVHNQKFGHVKTLPPLPAHIDPQKHQELDARFQAAINH